MADNVLVRNSVTVFLPSDVRYSSLVRMFVTNFASLWKFNIDDLNDIKLSINEIFLLILDAYKESTGDGVYPDIKITVTQKNSNLLSVSFFVYNLTVFQPQKNTLVWSILKSVSTDITYSNNIDELDKNYCCINFLKKMTL